LGRDGTAWLAHRHPRLDDDVPGGIENWQPELKTMVGLMLNSRQPMFMAWGPDRTWLHNDAFVPIAGDKHPLCLGQPAAQV
jgi:hypothetical protein